MVSKYIDRFRSNQPILTNFSVQTFTENKRLTTLTIFYNSKCLSGFEFSFNDSTSITTGYMGQSGSTSLTINLEHRKICTIRTFFGVICDLMEICTSDEKSLSQLNCFFIGSNNTLYYFLDTFNFEITSFFGDYYNYYGWYCLSNLGMNYLNSG